MPFALLIAAALQVAPAASELADMRNAYAQDCVQRDYGSFDDICNQLADQIRAYARSHPEAATTPVAAAPPAAARPAKSISAQGAQLAPAPANGGR